MEISRYLRKDTLNKKGECIVEFRMTWAGKKVRWSAGMRIVQKIWDDNKQRVKPGTASAVWINEELDRIEKLAVAVLEGYFRQNLNPGEAAVKRDIDELLGRVKVEAPVMTNLPVHDLTTVSGYWADYIKRNKARYSVSHIGTFDAALKMWIERWEDLKWAEVSQNVVESWVDFLIEEEFANSTTKIYLQRLGQIIEDARSEGIVLKVNMRKVYIDGYESIPTFHTMPEVRAILGTQYSSENLRIVADAYVFAIASGVRFSDLVRISEAEVKLTRDANNEMVGHIHLLQKKTAAPLVVTMTDLAVEIWMKYGGNPLLSYRKELNRGVIHKVTYRYLLQKMGKEAGITSETIKRWKVGNEWREERGPKWQFMSSHVARHTFAMIGLELGVPVEVLQKGLGHTDIASTLRYARISEGKASDEIKGKWKNWK